MRDAITKKQKAVITIYFLCFAQGAFTHTLDFAKRGWTPYHHGPLPIRIFWTALVFLDLLVLVLLLHDRRIGLLAALTVMLLDVMANSYADFTLHDPGFALALPLQCAFLGYILGSLFFLWPARRLH